MRISELCKRFQQARESTGWEKTCRTGWGAGIVAAALLLPAECGSGRGISAQAVPAHTVSVITANSSEPYQLNCGVTGPALAGVPGPTSTIAFTDATAGETLGTAPLGSQITTSLFGSPQIFPAGDMPVSIVADDFRGIGKLDVALANSDGTIAILLGNGDGTFQAPAIISTPATLSFSMTSADFNVDGKIDLALVDWHSDNVYVLLGNGDGTFQPAKSFPNSAGWNSEVISADVNGDAKPDLVITDFNNSEFSVLLGNGDGTFQPAIVTSTSPYPGGVAAGNFNGDNKLDLIVTSAAEVSFYPGNGDGTFGTPTNFPLTLGEATEGVAVADFNGDGNEDVAVTSIAGTYVLLGNGGGTFQSRASVINSYVGSYIVVGDFSGDGHTDLLISGYDPTSINMFLGQGDGTFQWYGDVADGGDTPGPIAAANFTGYGRLDLVIGNILSENASVLWNGIVTASGTLSGVDLPNQPPPFHNLLCAYGGDNNYAASTSNRIALLAQLAAPVISPPGGTYNSAQSATITDAMSGTAVYFTTDGTTPTQNSTRYTTPISITTSTTLNAIAYASGIRPSSVTTATYTLQVGPPVIHPLGGTYNSPFTAAITDTTPGATIYYTTDGSTPTNASKPYTGAIQVTSSMTLKAIAYATGFVPSSITAAAYAFPVATPVIHPTGGTHNSPFTAAIADTTPGATIYYTTDGSTPTNASTPYTGAIQVASSITLKAIAYATGFVPSSVTTATYVFSVATPVIQPLGGIYNSPFAATITDNTPAAKIHYTTDGSTPTSRSTVYTGTFQVASTETIEAIALESGFLNSAVATAAYTIENPSYTLTATTTKRTVTSGDSTSFKLIVTPSGGFSGKVVFSCSELPLEASCIFNPASVTPPNKPVSTTLAVSTTALNSFRNANQEGPRAPWTTGGGLALAGVLGILFLRRRALRALGYVLLLAGAAAFPSCGGGGSNSGGERGGGGINTPPGPYTVNVAASSMGSEKTVQLTLIVQ